MVYYVVMKPMICLLLYIYGSHKHSLSRHKYRVIKILRRGNNLGKMLRFSCVYY